MLFGHERTSNDDDSTAQTDYSGGVAFKLNFDKLKIAGSADMRYNPALPSFLVDIGIELPVAIPVGTTGLGIYGFRDSGKFFFSN